MQKLPPLEKHPAVPNSSATADSSERLELHPQAAAILGLDPPEVPDFIHASIAEHLKLVQEPGKAVRKNAPESAVTLVEVSGFPGVCVKEFRWRGWLHGAKGLLRPTQGLRTFRNGWRLLEAGIGAAAPLALLRKKHSGIVRTEWIVMEMIPGGMELDRFVLKGIESAWGVEEMRSLVRLLGRFVGSMHARGIFHSDLKTCNILVSQDSSSAQDSEDGDAPQAGLAQSVRFSLLDYDEVHFSREVSVKKRLKNLVQIFLSTPLAVNASSRLLFLSEYGLHAGLTRKERRQMARQVLNAADGREILYVGFDGDIREKWK
jgi:serine/threonine protein kinase